MFMISLDYPSYAEEVSIVKKTTTDVRYQVQEVISGLDIQEFQHLVRRVPVTDHVIEYAVKLVQKTRPDTSLSAKEANDYLEWGAGPRASQALIPVSYTHLESHDRQPGPAASAIFYQSPEKPVQHSRKFRRVE